MTSPLDCGGWLGSTCWTASDSAPYHLSRRTSSASGSERPPPVPFEMLYTVGVPKNRDAWSRDPVAGFTNGSSAESASAIETLAIPRFADGKI